MKKQLVCLIAIIMISAQASCVAMAKGSTSSPVKLAIKKYNVGNFTGCLQDCQYIVRRDPSNSVAYYYMAMSYVQAGKKDEAVGAYSKVLSLNPSARLLEYATTGKRCLETPDKCVLEASNAPSTDVDKFIASPATDGLSDKVKDDLTKKHLDGVRNKINADKDMDSYELRKFKDYTNSRSKIETNDAVAQKKPTNDEIVAALKVLNDAGLNPYSQAQQAAIVSTDVQQPAVNPYMPTTAGYQNQDMTQLGALLGPSGQSTGANSMSNMIPFMLAQNKNGTANYSPQMMQAAIMNSMMTDFNMADDKDKDK